MPSRFAHHSSEEQLKEKFGIAKIDFNIWEGYNIKPTNTVICLYQPENEIVLEKFFWAKKTPQDIQKARGETVLQKKMFGKSFREKRCVLLAHGFFEWKKVKDGNKTISTPYYFKLKNNDPFGVAGLYWNPAKDDEKARNRMIIITIHANEKVEEIFHRMPAILMGEDINRYIDMDTDPEIAQGLLNTYPGELMEYYEVENLVSKGDRTANTIVAKGKITGGLDDFF